MKIILTCSKEIDLDSEYKRVKKIFSGKQKTRQLKLLDLFKQGKFDEFINEYDNLPYCNKEGCSEKEFVGIELFKIINTIRFGYFNIDSIKIEK